MEVGSGLGFITTLIARDPRVISLIAVEADPRLARSAAERSGCLGAEVKNGVLAPEAAEGTTAKFYQRPDFWMSSLNTTDVPYDTVVEVPVIALNRLLRAEAISCIVCDIERGKFSC